MSVPRPLAAVSVALALAVVGVGSGIGTADHSGLAAENQEIFGDADRDMVPDCIEMIAHTDPAREDTDGDQIDDFEEILTFTSHDPSIPTRPVTQGMRVLVTTTPNASGGGDVYLHLMVRLVNLQPSEVAIHDIYASAGGVQVSLIPLIGYGTIRVVNRVRSRDGASTLFSVQLGTVEQLEQVLPCTIGVRACLGSKVINTGTLVMSAAPSEVAAVLPFSAETLSLQPVNTAVYMQDANPYYRGGGRVCEMGLSAIGSSPSGTLCEVEWARCKAAAGLRCSTSCSSKAGGTVVIPGGLGTITGG